MFKNVEKGSLLILDPASVTERDLEMISALDVYPPNTEYAPGDLLRLRIDTLPAYIRARFSRPDDIPLIWKVRFVVSKWAWNAMSLLETEGSAFMGVDQAISQIERTKLSPHKYSDAILYLHAYPHGLHPDSAIWLEEKNNHGVRTTERFYIREQNPIWPEILEEAKTKFIGFDPTTARSPIVWNLAPDLYGEGENIGKPFTHEYDTVDTMCSNGLERLLFDPRIRKERTVIDPEHPLLVRKKDAAE